jgi:hypothetical protein
LRMYYTGTTTPAMTSVPANANSFAFASTIPAQGLFDVGILTQPAGQSCVLTGSRGTSLANVNNVAVTCVNNTASTLVGTYTLLSSVGRLYLNFNADGTFTTVLALRDSTCNTATDTRNGNGVEYGTFTWNSTTNALTLPAPVAVDTNGKCGFSNSGTALPNMSVVKGAGSITVTAGPDPAQLTAIAAPNPTTSVVGAYVPEAGNGLLLVLHADNTFMVAETQGRGAVSFNSQERGCYSVAGSQITFVIDSLCKPDGFDSYDFNGPYGFGPFPAAPTSGPWPFTLEGSAVLVLNNTRWRRSIAN